MKKRLYILFIIIFLFFMGIVGINRISQTKERKNTHSVLAIMDNFNNVLELTLVNHKNYLENIPPEVKEPIDPPLPPIIDNETTVIEETVKEEVDFNTIEEKDNTIFQGNNKIIRGKKGIKEVIYISEYQNGELISKTVKNEKIIVDPVNEIIVIGTKPITESNASLVFEGTIYNKENTIFAFFGTISKCEADYTEYYSKHLCEEIQANSLNNNKNKVVVLRLINPEGIFVTNTLNYNITIELYTMGDDRYYIYGN